MSHGNLYRTIVAIAAIVILGAAFVPTEASAYRGGGVRAGAVHRGGAVAYRGGAYHGGVYRGRYVRPGVAVGAAAVGAAAAGAYYNNYNSAQCGYYPYPPCY